MSLIQIDQEEYFSRLLKSYSPKTYPIFHGQISENTIQSFKDIALMDQKITTDFIKYLESLSKFKDTTQ